MTFQCDNCCVPLSDERIMAGEDLCELCEQEVYDYFDDREQLGPEGDDDGIQDSNELAARRGDRVANGKDGGQAGGEREQTNPEGDFDEP